MVLFFCLFLLMLFVPYFTVGDPYLLQTTIQLSCYCAYRSVTKRLSLTSGTQSNDPPHLLTFVLWVVTFPDVRKSVRSDSCIPKWCGWEDWQSFLFPSSLLLVSVESKQTPVDLRGMSSTRGSRIQESLLHSFVVVYCH